MGTFHDNLGDLHGITVVVDTTGPQVVIGRCHEASSVHVLLHDADVHEDGAGGVSKQQYIQRAAKWGVFAKHKVLELDPKQVTSITPLNRL